MRRRECRRGTESVRHIGAPPKCEVILALVLSGMLTASGITLPLIDYIAADSIEAADRVLDLAKNPGVGHWREELADKRHRFLLVYSYLIVYRHETKPLQIVCVLHAARDVQSILGLSPD